MNACIIFITRKPITSKKDAYTVYYIYNVYWSYVTNNMFDVHYEKS